MRFLHLMALAGLTLLTGALTAADAFEGRIQYQMTGKDGKTRDFSMAMSGSKVRVDMSGAGHMGASIMDLKAHTTTVLMTERKTYMTMAFDPSKAGKLKGPKASFSKTGKSETIAGYKAEEWLIKAGDHESSVWGTTELGKGFYQTSGGQGQGGPDMDIPAELKEKGFLMLRMEDAAKKFKMEAVKVEPGKLGAEVFSVPEGYTEMKGMGGMMGAGMAGQGGGMPTDAAARMKAAMDKMTPEQRAMMEKMMQRHAPAGGE